MRVLAITGMHRSGTSLVAQACAAAGIAAGPKDDLLAEQQDNPEGFFEHRDLVGLNEDLLTGAGGHWFAPPLVTLLPDNTQVGRARSLLKDLGDFGGGQFLLKDPRLCLTWPFWQSQLDDMHVLYVYRGPVAVARSLARRNSFPLQYGLLLWEIYNRRALESLTPNKFTAVAYESIANGDVSLPSLMEQLADAGFKCSPGKTDNLFNPALDHTRVKAVDEAERLLTDSQRDLQSACEAICEGGALPASSMTNHERLYERASDFANALAPLAHVTETSNERDEAVALVAERTVERDQSLASLETLERDHGALVKAHDVEKHLHQQAALTLTGLQADHDALADAHDREVEAHGQLSADHRSLIEKHDALYADYDELDTAKRTLQGAHDRLQADHAALQDKADYLFFSLTESYRSLLTFEHSTMARLQRLTRRVYRLLTLQRGRNSAYEDLLERTHEHFDEFELEKPIKPVGKLQMAGDVLRYVGRNPAGSARSFSWVRLKRAVQVFFGSSSDELSVWVNARFPDADSGAPLSTPETLSESLDALELEFAQPENPVVSIIVPVYNDYRVTANCLASVHEHTKGLDYEVIIADDCSTDLTSSILERMSGVRVVRTPENLRFLRNCNLAAASARGEFLVFLNNDTAVTEAWLDGLLESFSDSRVGVTGPKLLFADGKLQEAGGIIWQDASGWNFGRADDPDKPAYNYRRDVDYVSGACLVIRSALWEQLGGFDEAFAPAYYEDADICFSARAAGYRVLYEPRSLVYHFEGVSNGTDLNSGVKQYQVVNQQVFRDKWKDKLDSEHFPNAEQVVYARDRSRAKPTVLVIDHYVPHHDKDAGGRSTYMYLKLLLEMGCRVQFMGANFFPHTPYTAGLQAMGIEVLVGESIARNLDAWLAEHASYIDEVFLHRPHVAEQFLPHLERMNPRPSISFFGHDLHYLRFEREAAVKDDERLRKEAAQWRKRELAVMNRSDRVYYFSAVEIEELRSQVPADKLRETPLYAMQLADMPAYAPTHEHDIMFVGGYNHPPNVDAAVWLAEEILPRLRAAIPDARLHLVGSNPTPRVLELAGDAVEVHGYISDEALAALYRRVGAAVVPLQYGAGVKGKVIEAIAANVPLVTTDMGAEGIPECDEVMWIANTGEGIADALVAILSGDASVEEKLSRAGDWLARHFDAKRAAAVLRRDMAAQFAG